MQASRFQALLIITKNVFVTFWISIIIIYKSYRGIYRRDYCDQILRWWARKILQFAKLSYDLYNPHGVRFEPGHPYILMSNHSSLYDIPLTFAALPGSIRMLTKKELFQVPIWGKGMAAGEFISIDRDNRRQAFRDLQEARKKMESGIILWVAPEGTRSRTGHLGPFKKGGFMLALQTRATIVPVGIRGAYDVLPAKTAQFRTGCHAQLHVGRPVDTTQYSKKNIGALMEEVEKQIRELAALPRHTPQE